MNNIHINNWVIDSELDNSSVEESASAKGKSGGLPASRLRAPVSVEESRPAKRPPVGHGNQCDRLAISTTKLAC